MVETIWIVHLTPEQPVAPIQKDQPHHQINKARISIPGLDGLGLTRVRGLRKLQTGPYLTLLEQYVP